MRDFKDYFSKNRVIRKVIDIPVKEYIKLILFKGLFLFMVIVVPMLVTDFSVSQILGGFLIFAVTGSLLALIILLTPHINTGNEFPLPDQRGEIKFSWFHHQLITTNDISNSNRFIRTF